MKVGKKVDPPTQNENKICELVERLSQVDHGSDLVTNGNWVSPDLVFHCVGSHFIEPYN